jgi:uncharacterized membrane protein YhaH (DUF805 family)
LSLFSFKGQIRPLPYALWSLGIFFSQYVAVFLLFRAQSRPFAPDPQFYISPLRALVWDDKPSNLLLMLALVYMLLAAWALAALAFRRAANANVSEWIAAYAIAPLVQVLVIVFLSCAPEHSGTSRASDAEQIPADSGWTPIAQGMLAGIGLTLFAVAVGALVFGSYGYGMFVVSPFVIGATTGYFGNRQGDIGDGRTVKLTALATALGGVVLVVTALEGVVCIVLAAPLAFLVALIGGLLGRALALHTRRSARQTLSGVALLPLVFAVETVLPPTTSFETTETIAIDAPPHAVWNAIVRMQTMDEPLALPFRLGVAYPLGGEIIGEGVGAMRRGAFSTGTALENVTEWIPDRKLAFTVINDIPSMQELSPYAHVHAPHVVGYFRTKTTSFEILPRGGGSSIIEQTSHELKLDPVFYWLPLARWIVHENNARVLAHIRRQAEQSVRAGGI